MDKTLRTSNISKTRKPHICWGCARSIPEGNSMTVSAVADINKIESIYWCEVCQTCMGNYCDQDSYFEFGSIKNNDEDWESTRLEMED
jgi:predicted amidophosphoribosyltransferase